MNVIEEIYKNDGGKATWTVVNDIAEGPGSRTYKDGSSQFFLFKDGKAEGTSTRIFNDDSVMVFTYINDCAEGLAIRNFPDGSIWKYFYVHDQHADEIQCINNEGFLTIKTSKYKTFSDKKASNNVPEEALCVICQDNLCKVTILPCQHKCMCIKCYAGIILNNPRCPTCTIPIRGTISLITSSV